MHTQHTQHTRTHRCCSLRLFVFTFIKIQSCIVIYYGFNQTNKHLWEVLNLRVVKLNELLLLHTHSLIHSLSSCIQQIRHFDCIYQVSKIRARMCVDFFASLALSLSLAPAISFITEVPLSFPFDIISMKTWIPKRKPSFKIKLIWIEIFYGAERKQPPETVVGCRFFFLYECCCVERESVCAAIFIAVDI